jgi:hypothetical protein
MGLLIPRTLFQDVGKAVVGLTSMCGAPMRLGQFFGVVGEWISGMI